GHNAHQCEKTNTEMEQSLTILPSPPTKRTASEICSSAAETDHTETTSQKQTNNTTQDSRWKVTQENSLAVDLNKIPHNLNGCPVRAQLYIILPGNIDRTQPNLNISGGLEVVLLNTVARAANFTLNYTL
ncbi:hypothetical protein CBL_21453, partial [Carabus blaptoides fortunei]